jgi:hypothetical protein
MTYELFISSRAQTSEPFISLVKEGFRLSAGFVRANDVEGAKAVRLYFDRAKHAVGFHFPNGAKPEEGTLRPKRHAGGLVVRARGFFTSQGIDPTVYGGRYEPKEVKDRQLKRLFVIQLRPNNGGKLKKPKA